MKAFKYIFLKKNRLFCLLLLFCLLSVAQPVLADVSVDVPFKMSCELDQNICTVYNSMTYPVIVTVENLGDDFKGTIQLMLYQGLNQKETVAYGQSAELLAGECTAFRLELNRSSIFQGSTAYEIPVRIDLIDEDGNSVYSCIESFTVPATSSLDAVVGIVSESENIGELLYNVRITFEDDCLSGSIFMTGRYLEGDGISKEQLTNVNILILDATIDDASWQAVSQWLVAGGLALMADNVYTERIGDVTEADGIVYWGMGRILTYKSDVLNLSDLEQLLYELIDEKVVVEIWKSPHKTFSGVVVYDAWTQIPNAVKYVVILIVYILIIGVVVFWILRKKDRRESAWLIIPILAALCFFVVFTVETDTRYSDAFLRYSSVLWLTDEGDVEQTGILITSPDDSLVMLSLSSDSKVMLAYSTNYYAVDIVEDGESLLSADYDLVVASSDENIDILLYANSLFEEYYLETTRVLNTGGVLETDIAYYNGAFWGTITNATDWNLKNVFVFYEGVYIVVGNLYAGESLDLNGVSVDGVLLGYNLPDFDTSVYEGVVNKKAIENYMVNLLDTQNIDFEQCYIGGFTTDYAIGLEDVSQIDSVNGLTLVMAKIEINDSGDEWQSISVLDVAFVSDEDTNKADLCYNYAIYNAETFEVYYRTDMDSCVTWLEWLNVTDGELLYVEFYNYCLDCYEEVFSESAYMTGDGLDNYVDECGRIRARIHIVNWSENDFKTQYVPLLTATGGKKND